MPATALPTPLLQHVQGSTRSINLPLNQDNRELYLLKELYGYHSFRVGQLEAIQSILQDKDTLVLIPTGGGKSLIYTMAAVLKQGLSIIIEPLKFIMEEQAEKLRQKLTFGCTGKGRKEGTGYGKGVIVCEPYEKMCGKYFSNFIDRNFDTMFKH